MKKLMWFACGAWVFSATFCTVQKSLPTPAHFPKMVYETRTNKTYKAVVTVGKVLFYDGILSRDGSISCASCHSPYNAFAHTDHALSHGINDSIGTRNAPALFNLAWHKSLMWDGAINHIDMQALAPITNPKEMNETLARVVGKLQKSAIYPALFQEAFGDTIITSQRILKSLAQFQLSLISANAKYDRVQAGKEQFTAQETNGYKLFKQHCNSCHTEPLFSNYKFANNGLLIDTTLHDVGKYKVTSLPADSLLFKVPSLRNLSYTHPYMHDGRFKKLREVLNHYTNGIQTNPTLSQELRQKINLTANEKVDLIAFLLTLDDKTFVFNPEHQFPKDILLTGK